MRKEDLTEEKLKKLENTIGQLNTIKKSNKKKKNPTFFTGEVIALLLITMVVSLSMGGFIVYKLYIGNSNFVDDELKEFISNYENIIDNYYEKVDKEELLDAALEGMLDKLDKNSTYIEEESSDNFNKQLTGSYEGFGMEIYNDEDGNIVVANVYKDTPADKAGLKQDDIITKFNDKKIENITSTKFVNMVSKEDKEIKLSYIRDGQEKEATLTKGTITLTSVSSKVISEGNNKIGYIRVSIFASNTDIQFKKELEKLENKNIDSLIIDLRSNSGGYLSSATNMISQFLDSSHVIYQIKKKDKQTKVYSSGNEDKNYDIAILVDNSSASASEIMTSALKEQYNATIIGVKTYGKGTVQELQELSNGDQYKFTTKEWLTSKGKTINGKGIKPDVLVSLNDEYYDNPVDENDNQLQTAIKELAN